MRTLRQSASVSYTHLDVYKRQEDEFGDTIRNLKEAMGILADYVSEISVEVKAIAQGDLTLSLIHI